MRQSSNQRLSTYDFFVSCLTTTGVTSGGPTIFLSFLPGLSPDGFLVGFTAFARISAFSASKSIGPSSSSSRNDARGRKMRNGN